MWTVYKNFPIPQKILNFIFLFLGFLIKYLFFVKKGFGKTYLEGIKEGLKTRNKINKVKFSKKNTKNYFKIEQTTYIGYEQVIKGRLYKYFKAKKIKLVENYGSFSCNCKLSDI